MVECKAVYAFKPKEPDELEFNQGDTLFVKVDFAPAAILVLVYQKMLG